MGRAVARTGASSRLPVAFALLAFSQWYARAALQGDADAVSMLQVVQAPKSHEPFWPGLSGGPNHTGSVPWVAPSNLTGGPKWKFVNQAVGILESPPLIDRAHNIYFTSQQCHSFKLARNGTVIWIHYEEKLDQPLCRGVPVLTTTNYYYTSSLGDLSCLDLETGLLKWKYDMGYSLGHLDPNTPMIYKDSILMSARRGADNPYTSEIIKIDSTDGTEISRFSFWDHYTNWTTRGHEMVLGVNIFDPAIADDTVILEDINGTWWFIDLDDMTLKFKKANLTGTPRPTEGMALGLEGKVAFFSQDMPVAGNENSSECWVFAMNVSDGSLLWRRNFSGWKSPPMPAVGFLSPNHTSRLAVLISLGGHMGGAPAAPAHKYGKLISLDPVTGKDMNFSFTPPEWPLSAPVHQSVNYPECIVPHALSSPIIGGDGTVYVGWVNGGLYAIKDINNDGLVSDSEVSMYNLTYPFEVPPSIAPAMLVAGTCKGLFLFEM